MSFAVVIPAFNDENTILDAVSSAVSQAELEEVIVVDDGSTDQTASRASSAVGPVRCVFQANAGPGAARNMGARSAAATHLIFLDADDELLDGALERFAAEHARGARLVRAGSASTGAGESVAITLPERSNFPFPRGTPLAGSFSVERDLFLECDGYDPSFRYGENSELLMRLTLTLDPCQIRFIDEAAVHVRRRVGRAPTHYDLVRLAAVDRMLDVHSAELLADPDTLRTHLLIASSLHRRAGRRREAIRYAVRAARVGRPSLRDVYRVGRAGLAPSEPVNMLLLAFVVTCCCLVGPRLGGLIQIRAGCWGGDGAPLGNRSGCCW